MTETKPLMAQYAAIKAEYKDAILLFQMGDFFECFYEDAEKVSDVLGLVLTSRSKSNDAPPMAGFPQKALDDYLPRLIAAGLKVAVARQMENPKNAKGIVQRAVTEVITQGTIATQEELLSKDKNYIGCVVINGKLVGVAFADISTGEFKFYEGAIVGVKELIEQLKFKELLKSTKDSNNYTEGYNIVVQPIDDKEFSLEKTMKVLLSHFSVPNLDPLGLTDYPLATTAAGLLLTYFNDTKKTEPKHIVKIEYFNPRHALHIDPTTQRNLEIFYNLKTHRLEGSLLGVIDETRTAMGHRLLYEWLSFPQTDPQELNMRYDIVEYYAKNNALYQELTTLLTRYPDLQRLTSALGLGRIHPKHLIVMAEAVEKGISINTLHKDLHGITSLDEEQTSSLYKLSQKISAAIVISATRPTFITQGYNKELDHLVELSTNGERFIKDLYNKEKVTSNIPGLKLSFNNVFGYSFELSRIQSANAPEHFIKKQTLVNTERYITEELKQLESQVLSARDQLQILEGELYKELVTSLQQYVRALASLGQLISFIDVLLSFATSALTKRYIRPTLTTTERTLKLEGMRHPVVEKTVSEFVPNDLTVDKESNFLILTGPNMGGKSTFVRQIALLQIMAQVGSFIPATSATIPLVDKVFARIGASDDISTGKSTFMVELSEVAYIVAQATEQSLVILDEVGRGTSTYEGISLAWGIAQYIANQIGCTTIFTTHFRELTDLADLSSKFINYKVNLKEENETIYFLHTVTKGRSDKSYGIQVAKLVNLPKEIIDTAFEVLESFEKKALSVEFKQENDNAPKQENNKAVKEGQLDFFSAVQPQESEQSKKLRELLEDVNPNTLTPIEALILVEKMKKELDEKE
ncbi:DNA mismatch repair protein MutS [Candidatus Dojkabacteria bacterium CG_4_10_14_3_um_filter_Dojkabacteria_WS6_41_9]|nr:MAG: DNA mismatch repair protein MutS [Candidatus Dojkabacteria bacterium CG_4_10_14_3_um_filter_Dojkabacteria_WS6_41_9]